MTDHAQNIRQGEELNWDSLGSYLSNKLDNIEDLPLEVLQFHGGHANLTYLLKYGDQEFVLRRPPFGKIAPGAHDMKREYRVLSKLNTHYPRAPKAFHFCDDVDIIGAPFVVMERREGVVVRKEIPIEFKSIPDIEQSLTKALIDAISDLHNVDYVDANLQDLGKSEGYLDRQVAGWTKRWNLSKTEEVPEMEKVLKWLGERIPTPQKISVVHNDFKLDNCQFKVDDPNKVSSVFDWDMCTIGDPLLDFGTSLSYWPDKAFAGMQIPIILDGDFPTKQDLKQMYADRTGLNLDEMSWYEAMGFVRLVVIAQQLYARFVQGATKDKRMVQLGMFAKLLAKVAWKTVQ